MVKQKIEKYDPLWPKAAIYVGFLILPEEIWSW